ncbi:hypothetical protein [Candidatus Paracaedibacter symbiosus]|uniref:hypothetical protein n=1 Tax=Candidatus Paracaedibacter symbiosus TaxID=244582 RepID=UPI000509EF9B|nr:hypothetical protein [Candidatus Paracaedibacter symbiosus]
MKKFLVLFGLLLFSNCLSYASDFEEESLCYTEKKYCKHCDHYHYKHYHPDDLSQFDKLKRVLKLDYSSSSIADSSVQNDQVIHLKEILHRIDMQLKSINKHTSKFQVKIDLSENYLRDGGLKELRNFIKKIAYYKKT